MVQLNHDIVEQIVKEVDGFHSKKERQATFRALAALSRSFSRLAKARLFKSVKWPHPDQYQDEGLRFFPETLWGYFQTFHLDWPDYWPDTSPPTWGAVNESGEYMPKHLNKFEHALTNLTKLHTLQITCPFYPPTSLIFAIVACPNIKDLRIVDTPYNNAIVPNILPVGLSLERLTCVPVGETNRVGEGPFEKKYSEISYYTCSYRKKFWADSHGSHFTPLPPGWASMNIFCLAKIETLKYIQISGRYCTLHDFQAILWPNLETLVLSGPEPYPESTTLTDVVARMPKLWDLRVLFLQPRIPPGTLNLPQVNEIKNVSGPTVFAKIRNLAVSSACTLERIPRYFTSLERLTLTAVSNNPRVPVAWTRQDVNKLMDDFEKTGNGEKLKVLRITMEDGVDSGLFKRLGHVCPMLENLEVEVCGYQNRDSGFEWTDYGDALEKYGSLERLRIGIPFEGYDENDSHVDPEAFLRGDRRDFGTYLASRVHTLYQIGFEYRMRAGSHRYEDRWLDFDIERCVDGSINLWELKQTWYPFPNVWDPVLLQE